MNELRSSPFDTITINAVKWPLNIVFQDIGGLSPAEDVTPQEAVHLVMMLACAITGGYVDYASFVRQNALERHFTTNDSKDGNSNV